MKKAFIKPIAYTMLGLFSLTQTGCFGGFHLTRKVWSFNDGISSNNFVKTIVFYVLNIIPVYGIAGFVDVVILNLIEFWTGSNPLAMNEGDVEIDIIEKDGVAYEFMVTKNKYQITTLNGEKAGQVAEFFYNPADLTWNYSEDGETTTLAQFTQKDGIDFLKVNTGEGEILVEANEYALNEAANKLKEENVAVNKGL
jgi:hypothetical protein